MFFICMSLSKPFKSPCRSLRLAAQIAMKIYFSHYDDFLYTASYINIIPCDFTVLSFPLKFHFYIYFSTYITFSVYFHSALAFYLQANYRCVLLLNEIFLTGSRLCTQVCV